MLRAKEGATLWHEGRGVDAYMSHIVRAGTEEAVCECALCHRSPVTRYGACIHYESNCSSGR